MARFRTVKPEYWPSDQAMSMSRDARLCFIGLWNFCDDSGTHPANPRTLKAEVFPGDDDVDVASLVAEMIEQGLVMVFEVGGKPYWHVTGWHHQKIDKPSYKHPLPDGSIPRSFKLVGDKGELYGAFRGVFDECSKSVRTVKEGKVEEGKRKEGKVEEGRGPGRETEPSPPPPEGEPLFSSESKTADTRRTLPTPSVNAASFDDRVFLSIHADDGTPFDITNAGVAEISAEYPKLDVRGVLHDFAGMCKEQPKFRVNRQVIADSLKQHLPRINNFYN